MYYKIDGGNKLSAADYSSLNFPQKTSRKISIIPGIIHSIFRKREAAKYDENIITVLLKCNSKLCNPEIIIVFFFLSVIR